MSPLNNFNYDDAMEATGQWSEACRHLSDKILAAFTHAYAVGGQDVAKKLKTALAANEKNAGASQNRRASDGVVGQADLWIKFVDTRGGYNKACDKKGAYASSIAASFDDIKDAYRQWSMG
jgi:hypothetical protein